jgi:hypothetical protein
MIGVHAPNLGRTTPSALQFLSFMLLAAASAAKVCGAAPR